MYLDNFHHCCNESWLSAKRFFCRWFAYKTDVYGLCTYTYLYMYIDPQSLHINRKLIESVGY